MNKLKVRAHTSYLGNTGYAAHARGFFRALAQHCDLRIRNFNWESAQNLQNYVNQTDLEIVDQITLATGEEQRADFPIQDVGEFQSFGFKNTPDDFVQDVDIVLIEPSHYYFFEEYKAKTKIAYTVWESTKVSDLFLLIIKKFDAVWVVSQWHKNCLINQGVEASKIWVVPEGVDSEFNPEIQYPKVDEYNDDRFKFLFFGRWDYRKSVPDILRSFLSEFKPEEPVDLILSADNPFPVDGMYSTEERLVRYGLQDPRIKIKHFPSRSDYLSYLHNGHAMITCARSEGWNIPLCEAIAAGIPVTYSDWGAPLEFCGGLASPVKIVGEVPTSDGMGQTFFNGYDVPGNYCLPDFEDLRLVLRDIYSNYQAKKQQALIDSKVLRDGFNWTRIGEIGAKALDETVRYSNKIAIVISTQEDYVSKIEKFKSLGIDTLLVSHESQMPEDVEFFIYQKHFVSDAKSIEIALDFVRNLDYSKVTLNILGDILDYDLELQNSEILSKIQFEIERLKQISINVNFIEGAKVEIIGRIKRQFLVTFIDAKNNQTFYESYIWTNNWTSTNRRYFTDWLIQVRDAETKELVFEHRYDASNKRVFICLESSSLGDSIAWFPAIDEFRKKHNCQVIVSTFRNELFQSEYPELEFVAPGSVVHGIYAMYTIGWYYTADGIDLNRQPEDPKTRPMQATSFDILGIEHKQIRTKIRVPDAPRTIEEDYVCIGVHATAQPKYWNNPNGWNELIDWFDSQGIKVVLISREPNGHMGNWITNPKLIDKSGDHPLESRIIDLKHAKMFIGVGSGLSWLAWATGTPTALISGFSGPDTEFLGAGVVRIFNPYGCHSCFNRHRLDAGDWNWCPDHKGTERQFECTKKITSQWVIGAIRPLLNNL